MKHIYFIFGIFLLTIFWFGSLYTPLPGKEPVSLFFGSYFDSIFIYDTLKTFTNDSLLLATELKEGKMIYKKNCNKCHSLYAPSDFTMNVWKKNLKEMKVKSGINEVEYQKILVYLSFNCKDKR